MNRPPRIPRSNPGDTAIVMGLILLALVFFVGFMLGAAYVAGWQ